MTDEESFHRCLADEPDNHSMRLVFADWLEERGDWRATGYRWMGLMQKWPDVYHNLWAWWCASPPDHAMVGLKIINAMDHEFKGINLYLPSLRAAEESLCQVAVEHPELFTVATAPATA